MWAKYFGRKIFLKSNFSATIRSTVFILTPLKHIRVRYPKRCATLSYLHHSPPERLRNSARRIFCKFSTKVKQIMGCFFTKKYYLYLAQLYTEKEFFIFLENMLFNFHNLHYFSASKTTRIFLIQSN